MDGFHFVSIVGTQVMSVLNPILSLIEDEKGINRPEYITLLVTPYEKSRNSAWLLKDFLVSSLNYNNERIEIIEISNDLSVHNDLLPAHMHMKRITDEYPNVIFNIAGGMNFQIGASLYTITAPIFHIVYPEDRGIHRITIERGGLKDYKLLTLPKPVDVLSLQGIGYTSKDKLTPGLFYVIKKHNLKFPSGQYSVKIGNVFFDGIWNVGNKLVFLNILLEDFIFKKKAAILDHTRRLLAFAESRIYSGELFHRDIIVLTDMPYVEERLRRESKGKIKTIKSPSELQKYLRKNVQTEKPVESSEESYLIKNSMEGRGILYLTLGRDILPTLIALFSHRPRKVVFFYTPKDHVVEGYKKAIIEHRNLLPANKVCFYPCSLFGSSIYDYKDEKDLDEPRFFNITPGTKSQTAFITLLAKKTNSPLYSIRTDTETLEEFPSGAERELSAPEPLSLLLLGGQTVPERGYGITEKEILENKDLYEDILTFFKTLPEDTHIKNVLTSGVTTEQGTLTVFPEENRMKILFKGKGRKVEWSSIQNKWFEELIGYVMILQGAHNVRVRILTARDDDAYSLTEIDVVARFGTTYYVISCKAGKLDDYEQNRAATEISAVSRLFGRFAIPLLASLQYNDDPVTVNSVYMFGFRTFSDKEKMRILLECAKKQLKDNKHETSNL